MTDVRSAIDALQAVMGEHGTEGTRSWLKWNLEHKKAHGGEDTYKPRSAALVLQGVLAEHAHPDRGTRDWAKWNAEHAEKHPYQHLTGHRVHRVRGGEEGLRKHLTEKSYVPLDSMSTEELKARHEKEHVHARVAMWEAERKLHRAAGTRDWAKWNAEHQKAHDTASATAHLHDLKTHHQSVAQKWHDVAKDKTGTEQRDALAAEQAHLATAAIVHRALNKSGGSASKTMANMAALKASHEAFSRWPEPS